jgi:hypothetical protein
MTWSEILAHVQQMERCEEESEARRQIGGAIEDGKLQVQWADECSRWGSSSPIQPPDDAPPRDADYWLKCDTDPSDLDQVREPPPYDATLVNKRRAAHLEKTRRFRKPIFSRDQALKLWSQSRGSRTIATQTNAITFLADILKVNRDMKRDDAWKACKVKFPELSERGFLSRVWPKARERAQLEPVARAGRKPTRK